MQTNDQKEWDDWKAKNTDPYGGRIMEFAEDWANLMEARMVKGEKLEDIAKETSREADTDGITGFMYGAAVQSLSICWKHGEKLRIWHNAEHGVESTTTSKKNTGVVNPAILTIDTK